MNKPRKKNRAVVLILAILILGLGLYIGKFVFDVGGDVKQAAAKVKVDAQTDVSLQRLIEAEKLVGSDENGAEHGNTTQAKRIALQYSVFIEELRKELFTQGKIRQITFGSGAFDTYCRLNKNSCAIIVNIPQLSDFTDEAKADLQELAWAAAVVTLEQYAPEALENLAVGIRGSLVYDVVLVGNREGIQERLSHSEGRKTLKAYFQ